MKTIFITVFQGTEFRNIIRTDIYRELVKRRELRLVLLTDSQTKREYFESQFNAPNAVYEVIDNYKPHWSSPIFSFLKFNLINSSSLDVKRKREAEKNGNWPKYLLKLAFNRLFAQSAFRWPVRLAYRLINQNAFGRYFKKYEPALVVSAHPFSDIEACLLREAKKRSIPTVGLIISWDKLTSRNMVLVLPDKLVVPNKIVKRDAMRLADVAEDNILVAGFPIFDFHFNTQRRSKEEFARRAGLNPNKRYLLFCPEGKTVINSDGEMAALLDELIASGELPQDLQLIIRLPPNDTIDLKQYKTDVIVQRAGKRFSKKERGVDWDMDENDFRLLADTLYHLSVIVQYASTIALEAAIFNKPILSVNIPFKNYPSIDWVYQYNHCRNLLKSRGIRKVYSKEELVSWIKNYLRSPQLDSEGREELRKEQCYSLDGRAGRRVADFLLAMIELKT